MINVCAELGGNLGKPKCDVTMGRPKFALPTTGKEFTAAQMTDSTAFKAALLAAMLLGKSDVNKVYAFPEMRDITNNTGDPQTQALADGYEEVLNEALPKYLLRSTPGVCVQQKMASFNGWGGGMYIVDHNNILWYRKTTSGGAKAFTCGYLYTNPPMFKGSADINTANTRLTFGSLDEFKYGVGALKLDFSVKDLVNIVDIILSDLEDENVSGALNNVLIIGAKTDCENMDLYDTYQDTLASALRWRVYTSNNTVLAIDTVTKNATLRGWNITINATDYNNQPDGTVFYVDLADPAVLNAAGVVGIEGVKLRFVKA